MIPWIDIASIVFVCVTMNHLGLVAAIESATKRELPIVNCPKCLTFWSVLAYLIVLPDSLPFWEGLGVGFLSSYLAIWLELLEGYIDTLYLKLYEKIYQSTADHKTAAGSSSSDSAGSMS